MADITIIGFFQSSKIVNNANNISIIVDEFQPSYTYAKTGEKHQAHMLRWHVIFPKYFIKFIKTNMYKGMLVKIKGRAKPRADIEATDDEENIREYINVLGETISTTYNSYDLTKDEERLKKSKKNTDETPDLENYLTNDF